jgi:predicted RNA binding protein YcfA (HicA-like mRNA interferase family)
MKNWTSVSSSHALRALEAIGWRLKQRCDDSHSILEHDDWPDFVWAFRDDERLSERMLARIAKHTGLTPNDL